MASKDKEYRTYGVLLMFLAILMIVGWITRLDAGVVIILNIFSVLVSGGIGWKLYRSHR